jgi:hypothetical protein
LATPFYLVDGDVASLEKYFQKNKKILDLLYILGYTDNIEDTRIIKTRYILIRKSGPKVYRAS